MTTPVITTEQQVLESLDTVIDIIACNHQINPLYIPELIEQRILKPDGNAPHLDGEPPEVYTRIVAHVAAQRKLIEQRKDSDNASGALLHLQPIRDEYGRK